MKNAKDQKSADEKRLVEREVEAGTAGALAGAAIGAVAGAPGLVAGAVIGAIAGAVTGRATEKAAEAREAEDRELDRSTSLTEAGPGAPNLEHPPARVVASVGLTPVDDDEHPADEPTPPPRS